MAALLGAELLAISTTTPIPTAKFLIMVSGFASIAPCHGGVLEKFEHMGGIPIPSLHVYGTADTWVHAERSKDLMEHFSKEVAVPAEHEGG
jgi:alpha-beta hydrolase superfamily lysophospholipase